MNPVHGDGTHSPHSLFHATTIVSVRRGATVAIAGDGQVSFGATVVKDDAVKVRRLEEVGTDRAGVLVGFAGGAADAFALLERFEARLKESPANMLRAAIELAKQWRSDRALRRLESMLVVADRSRTLLLSGQGDVVEPTDGICAIGSGGAYALAAARALTAHTPMAPGDAAREALLVAGAICVYTNTNPTVLVIDG